jgi:glycosyltransferase involved in cell wall biosynthesis
MERVRILHVITGLNRGGAEGVLFRLIERTRTRFDHVVAVLSGEGHFGPLLRSSGISVHVLGLHPVLGAASGLAQLCRIIRRERPDVVQTWLYHSDLLGGLASWLTSSNPVIWAVRNNNLDAASIGTATRLVARCSAALSRFVPQLIVYNSASAALAHRAFGYRAPREQVIRNGFDLDRFRPDAAARARLRSEMGLGANDIVIGMVARWDVQKDHANLLRAMQKVAQSRPEAILLLVGSGMESANPSLRNLLHETQLEQRTRLSGPRDDIPAVMNALDLHVLSSLGEAFPNAVAEAMACGTPCVATDVGDAACVVGDAGWVVPARDSELLAAAILEALDAIAIRSRDWYAARCRERVATHFSLTSMADAFSAAWLDARGRC